MSSQQAGSGSLTAGALAGALHRESGQPLHQQLERALRNLIESGQVQPGAIMPGEHELALGLGLSRHTVRHALGVLAAEGLLRRERGRGTTVVSNGQPRMIERGLTSFYAFAWEVRARGAEQRSYVLERNTLQADRSIAERLALRPQTLVERIVRLRTADGEPLVLETAYLQSELAAQLTAHDLERDSIYDALERLGGFRIVRAHETIRPVVLDGSLASLLGVRVGTAAFNVERTTWSDRGPIEWQESLIRGDRYLYSVDLPRGER